MTGIRHDAEAALVAAGLSDVPRETIDRLITFARLLREWSMAQNLVGPTALDEVWTRHVGDSAQLVAIAPRARRWVDIGSGAGFPGLVVAALVAGDAEASVTLVEANTRKCAFLREVGRSLDLPIDVRNDRIEKVLSALPAIPDALSARALASVDQLVKWTLPLIEAGSIAYFHKGLDFDREWKAIAHPERFDLVLHQSRIGSGVIAEIRAKPAS